MNVFKVLFIILYLLILKVFSMDQVEKISDYYLDSFNSENQIISMLLYLTDSDLFVSSNFIFDSKGNKIGVLVGRESTIVKNFLNNLKKYRHDIDIIPLSKVRNYDLGRYDIMLAITNEAASYLRENYNRKSLNIICLAIYQEYLWVPDNFVLFYNIPNFEKIVQEINKSFGKDKSITIVYSLDIGIIKEIVKKLKSYGVNINSIAIDGYNIDSIEKNLRDSEIIFLLPDVFTLDEDNLLKLIYLSKKNRKIIISTQKVLLDYGVDIVYVIDYDSLAKQVIDFINSYHMLHDKTRVIFPEKFVILSRNLGEY